MVSGIIFKMNKITATVFTDTLKKSTKITPKKKEAIPSNVITLLLDKIDSTLIPGYKIHFGKKNGTQFSSEGKDTIKNYSLKSIIDNSASISKALEKGETPDEFICPISQEIFDDPVIAETGITYSRSQIQKWCSSTDDAKDPVSRGSLGSDIYSNTVLAKLVWALEKNLMLLSH